MSKKELPIQFHLVHIEDNQFSPFDEMLDVDKPIEQIGRASCRERV